MPTIQQMNRNRIILFSLQTCSHCKDVRKMLQKRKVSFRTLYIDLMVGSERNDAMRQLKRVNPSVSFPTLVIGETVIVGNKQEEIKKALDGL